MFFGELIIKYDTSYKRTGAKVYKGGKWVNNIPDKISEYLSEK